MPKSVYIISPTESILTHRGDRHPRLASHLNNKGYNICYITTDFYHAEKRFFTKEEMESARQRSSYEIKIFHICGYRDNVSLGRLWGYIVLSLKIFIFLLKRVHRQDVILVSCRPPEMMLVARWLKCLKGCMLILDVRDVWPDGLPLRGGNIVHRLFKSYCNLLNCFSAGGADFAFYTAKGFLTWLLRYCPKEKTAFIPLGYSGKRWESSRELAPSDFEDGLIQLVFVGDLAKSMDVVGLLRSVAANSRYSLTFIGGGERLEETRSLVKELNAKNIFFLGRFTQEQVVEAMQKYHVSVVPLNVKFSMPNKLFDALGARRPLLVYGNNDAADFVDEHHIGWKMPFDEKVTEDFLNKWKTEEIVDASRHIGEIRDGYSKEYLYQRMIEEIDRLFLSSTAKD